MRLEFLRSPACTQYFYVSFTINMHASVCKTVKITAIKGCLALYL